MKILLMCGAGASSGFMAQAMRKAAKEQGIENFEIIARSEAEMMNNLQGTDLVMFGPHLAFKREALEKDLKKFNIPFAFIDKDAYGLPNHWLLNWISLHRIFIYPQYNNPS